MPLTRVIARVPPSFQGSPTVTADLKGLDMRARLLRIGLLLAVAGAAVGVSVSSASAGLLSGLLPPCGATSYPFTNWGDGAGYCAFPNLGFESGTTGWKISGSASVVSGNEPWNVSGAGTHSLQLAPGASATSAALPISLLDPYVRFFARSAGASGSLQVQVVFRGLLGNLTGILNYGSLPPASFSTWQPTLRISSILALPLATSTAQIVVKNTSRSGSWQVDDFYLDPCVSRIG